MQYCRIDSPSAESSARSCDNDHDEMEAQAKALRGRAERYRDLATHLYNRELAAEVENFARELEQDAGNLETINLHDSPVSGDDTVARRTLPALKPRRGLQ